MAQFAGLDWVFQVRFLFTRLFPKSLFVVTTILTPVRSIAEVS